jgi:hypothetical protein
MPEIHKMLQEQLAGVRARQKCGDLQVVFSNARLLALRHAANTPNRARPANRYP